MLLVFSVLFGGFCAAAVASLSKGSESGYTLARIAVVQEYDTKKGAMMLDLISEQDFAAPVSIDQTDAETAQGGLLSGYYDAVLILPDGYARDISRGDRTQARLILSRSAAVHSGIVALLADFGETLLSTAQFGIFAGQEAVAEASPELEDRFLVVANALYLQDAICALDQWFSQREVPYAGLNVTYTQWYALLYAALFFHLSSLFFLPLRRDCTTPMLRRLACCGVSDGAFVFGKLLFSLLLQAVVLACLCLIFPVSAAGLPAALLALLLSACVGTALLLCLPSSAAATAVTALGAVGLFSSGGVLPRMELPSAVCAVGDRLPLGLSARLGGALLGARPAWGAYVGALLWCAAALFAVWLRLRAVRSGKGAEE